MTLFTSVLLICVLIIRTFVLNCKRYFFNFPPAAPGSGYPQKDPLHFLPPGQYLSEPLPPKAGLVDADADYNVIMPDKCHVTIQDNTEPPDTQAGKKMPDYPVCTDLEGIKDHHCLLYDSSHYKT